MASSRGNTLHRAKPQASVSTRKACKARGTASGTYFLLLRHLDSLLITSRYWNDPYFKAVDLLKPVCEKNNLTLAEVALRWISHHSLLSREHGDSVIIGASSTKHLEQNLVDLEKGPLRQCPLGIRSHVRRLTSTSSGGGLEGVGRGMGIGHARCVELLALIWERAVVRV